MSAGGAAPSARAQLRAGLIALVVLIYGFTAAPLPRSVTAGQLQTEIAREEIDRWVGILGAAGIAVTPERLAELTVRIGGAIAEGRTTLVEPFRPWLRFSGTGQGWGLFTYPDIRPRALVIEGRTEGGDWRRLYRSLDPEADWRGALWRHRRIRAPTDTLSRRSQPGAVYHRFSLWASELALADHPELDEIQVSFERRHSVRPGATPKPVEIVHIKRKLR